MVGQPGNMAQAQEFGKRVVVPGAAVLVVLHDEAAVQHCMPVPCCPHLCRARQECRLHSYGMRHIWRIRKTLRAQPS